MSKWIAEFELEDGDTMPEHMDLNYKGVKIDFHCKPLEQEPTTKNNLGVDCISRQAVLDLINADWKYEGLEIEINNLPLVTPQKLEIVPIAEIKYDEDKLKELVNKAVLTVTSQDPKTGHWIFQKIIHGKRMWCSNCDSSFDLCCNQIKRYDEATKKEYLWSHCPWCGAKMVEPQERSDKE